MRTYRLTGDELERALSRATQTWAEDDEMTMVMMRRRFSKIPPALLRQRLKDEGLYPRSKRVFTMSNLRSKAVVPGLTL